MTWGSRTRTGTCKFVLEDQFTSVLCSTTTSIVVAVVIVVDYSCVDQLDAGRRSLYVQSINAETIHNHESS